jgi:hypothetical protein
MVGVNSRSAESADRRMEESRRMNRIYDNLPTMSIRQLLATVEDERRLAVARISHSDQFTTYFLKPNYRLVIRDGAALLVDITNIVIEHKPDGSKAIFFNDTSGESVHTATSLGAWVTCGLLTMNRVF